MPMWRRWSGALAALGPWAAYLASARGVSRARGEVLLQRGVRGQRERVAVPVDGPEHRGYSTPEGVVLGGGFEGDVEKADLLCRIPEHPAPARGRNHLGSQAHAENGATYPAGLPDQRDALAEKGILVVLINAHVSASERQPVVTVQCDWHGVAVPCVENVHGDVGRRQGPREKSRAVGFAVLEEKNAFHRGRRAAPEGPRSGEGGRGGRKKTMPLTLPGRGWCIAPVV